MTLWPFLAIKTLKYNRMKPQAWIAIALMGLTQCQTVPLTGRQQVAWIPDSELNTMSFTQYQQVLQETPLSKNRAQTNMVKTVGNKIKTAVETYLNETNQSKLLEGFQWEFNLLEDPTVNAWCMPGGKVAFYTGIMPICQDEAGVAVVMGHEVAHAIAQHGNERMTHGLIQQAGGVALAIAVKDKPAETQNLFMTAYGVGTTLGGMLPFSRQHESEADELGLIFMALAGYDPHAAPEFWKRMSGQGGQQPPEFLSTHPSHDTRISNLNKAMPKAMKYYKP